MLKRFAPLATVLVLATISGCTPEALQLFADSLERQNRINRQRSAVSAGSPAAHATSSETVCVKYETQTGWSRGYQVDATIAKGSYLNQATSTFDYEPYATYAVVFWQQGQASILRLNYYSGSITAYGHSATDQQGRDWNVSKTSYCY